MAAAPSSSTKSKNASTTSQEYDVPAAVQVCADLVGAHLKGQKLKGVQCMQSFGKLFGVVSSYLPTEAQAHEMEVHVLGTLKVLVSLANRDVIDNRATAIFESRVKPKYLLCLRVTAGGGDLWLKLYTSVGLAKTETMKTETKTAKSKTAKMKVVAERDVGRSKLNSQANIVTIEATELFEKSAVKDLPTEITINLLEIKHAVKEAMKNKEATKPAVKKDTKEKPATKKDTKEKPAMKLAAKKTGMKTTKTAGKKADKSATKADK